MRPGDDITDRRTLSCTAKSPLFSGKRTFTNANRVSVGITSAEGSPLQLFSGPGSEAMQHAPWSFVPTVLVPIWLILHGVIAAQLWHAKPGQAVTAVV